MTGPQGVSQRTRCAKCGRRVSKRDLTDDKGKVRAWCNECRERKARAMRKYRDPENEYALVQAIGRSEVGPGVGLTVREGVHRRGDGKDEAVWVVV